MTQMTLRECVAEEVRVELARKNRSASWLAREAGKTQTWISSRLTCKVPMDVDDLETIAQVLDLPIGDLMARINTRRSTAMGPGVSQRERLAPAPAQRAHELLMAS